MLLLYPIIKEKTVSHNSVSGQPQLRNSYLFIGFSRPFPAWKCIVLFPDSTLVVLGNSLKAAEYRISPCLSTQKLRNSLRATALTP
jgi:hypothetical protein